MPLVTLTARAVTGTASVTLALLLSSRLAWGPWKGGQYSWIHITYFVNGVFSQARLSSLYFKWLTLKITIHLFPFENTVNVFESKEQTPKSTQSQNPAFPHSFNKLKNSQVTDTLDGLDFTNMIQFSKINMASKLQINQLLTKYKCSK